MAADFCHLHVHSEYSLLDGYSKTKELAKYAAKLGMSAIALTDHGNLYGAIEFYKACKDAGVKPIIGVETYVAPGKMTAKTGQDRDYRHLILLAMNETGYRNLLDLTTRSWLEGYYYKPRIDRDLLAEKNEGLIALSACLGGEIAGPIVKGDYEQAKKNALWYKGVFGDRYYIELQEHGLKEDATVTPQLIKLAHELDIPVVATNDNHYTTKEQHEKQDLLLCVQTSSTIDDPKRMRFETQEFYLKSPDEMAALFPDTPDAITNSLVIAERCNLTLNFGRINFPPLEHVMRPGESADECLARSCRERLPIRYPNADDFVRQRLEYELEVVRATGFSAYILLVWDFVAWARERKIPCGPRGSAAGSIILYLLSIADVDPIEYGLTFERFLNPERVQMPDVDMDFADERRAEVINYCIKRYGADHVAQMVTFGRLLARAAIRDVGRALNYPLNEVERVAKLIPQIPVGMTIDKSLDQVKELKQLYDSDPQVSRLLDAAKSIEGVVRHASTHAAGVVISGDPLVWHSPLQKVGKSDTMVMTQYPQKALEEIGLLKMDFLGLANLTMLAKAVEYIRESRGVEIDLATLPLDDAPTFQRLSEGETHSVFQLEGSGMTRYVKELKPQTVRHLAAMVALYRPGPMAHIPNYIARKEGRQQVEYPDPSLEDLLEESYGIIVYQDQVLQIVQRVAGYSLGQADILRRAMGKKDPEVMRKERANFLDGAKARNYPVETAEKLWEYIEPFAGYAFNKCMVGSTLIRDTAGRTYTIAELAERPPTDLWLHSVTPGGEVIANRFVEAFPTGAKPVVRVSTRSGRTLVCTADHKLLTPSGVYRPVQDIGVGGRIIAAAQGSYAPQQADDSRNGASTAPPVRGGAVGSPDSQGAWVSVQDAQDDVRHPAPAGAASASAEPHRLQLGLLLARGVRGDHDRGPGVLARDADRGWLGQPGADAGHVAYRPATPGAGPRTRRGVQDLPASVTGGDPRSENPAEHWQAVHHVPPAGELAAATPGSRAVWGRAAQEPDDVLAGGTGATHAASPPWADGRRWLHRVDSGGATPGHLLRHRTAGWRDRGSSDADAGGPAQDPEASPLDLWSLLAAPERRSGDSGLSLHRRVGLPGAEARAVSTLPGAGGGSDLSRELTLGLDEIVSIEPAGYEPTFNLTMEAPHHNYVLADGLVTANSHAFCYAFVAYQTAYLKANYPVEWMAAVLTTDVAKPEKIVSALGECRRLDIEILLPSINYSQVRFTVEPLANPGKFTHGIRFGLAAIKNVGEGAVESVVAEREKNGPFKSLDDFCSRVDLRTVNKRVIEALVKCGAMDEFGPRERVLAGIDACMGAGQSRQKAASVGQQDMFSMFGGGDDDAGGGAIIETQLPVVPEVGRREKLTWEKEAIGVFLSDHPFMDAARWFASSKYTVTSAISADIAEKQVTVAGIVAAVRRITTRKGDTMVVATFEDLHGSVEVVGFPRTFQQYGELFREDAILVVQGKVDARDDRLQIIAEGVEEPQLGEDLETAADEDVQVYQPTVTVDPNPRAAWRPKKEPVAENGNGHASSNGNGANGHSNGNGNSHSNGNGNGNGKPVLPEIVVRRLRLLIPRSENEASDITKIQHLDHVLGGHGDDGQSPCEVIVVLPEGRFRVSDPDYRVRLTADLTAELRRICGDEHVLIERS